MIGVYSLSCANKDDKPVITNSTVEKQLYTGGADGTEVALYKIIGGGHNAPSIQEQYSVLFELIVGKQNHDIEMADEVWNFFRNKSK